MKFNFLISISLLLVSAQSFAVVCYNAKGRNYVDEVFYDLSNSFSSSNNAVGKVVEIKKQFSTKIEAECPVHFGNKTTMRSYVTSHNIIQTVDSYQYLPINDYLIGAMKITDSSVGVFYPPIKYKQVGGHANVTIGDPFPVQDQDLTFRLKVIKPFVDFVPIPKTTMFTVYVTTSSGDALTTPVYRISYSGSISVPQTCKINTGDTLEMKFGNIPASAFSQAGPGNKPSNVNKQTHTLAIQCSNIESQAILTLRLEAEKVSGDMMISDNSDIGFKVSDQNDKVLVPNSINSVIPFNIRQQPANVTIKAWPVSITGSTPKIGPFKSRGYLRIDFE